MGENENISKNGWSEYGRLVLKELERLNEGQDKLREDFDKQFKDLNEKMTEFKSTEQDVKDLKEWREKVTEVWSPTQMTQSKDEIYEQKNRWQRLVGIVLAVQIIFGVVIALFKVFS
jgi:chromosome segregation ATPase